MLPCRVAVGILLAVVFSWAPTSPVEAAPRAFVSASGDDGDSDPNNTETTNLKTNCGPIWPCRTFAKALSMVEDGGEVVALSSGDYEPFLIYKSVSVVTAPGVHAVITATSGSAITIDAFDGRVALRGLTLNGLGGETGINVVSVGTLYVEDCVLNAFSGNAIAFVPVSAAARLHLRDTTVRDSGSSYASGIYISTGGYVSIDRLRMDENRHGLVVDGGQVTIRDSVAAHQIQHAVWARGLNFVVELAIENCTITGTELGSGIIAGDPSEPRHFAIMSVSNSTVTSNKVGISAYPSFGGNAPTTVLVSNTTIVHNRTGIDHSGAAAVLSRGNNALEDNHWAEGDFTGGFWAK